MEVALRDDLPTFSGGLGVLAGDFLKSAADLALPVVGVTLLYRKGYFVQHLDESGLQSESPEQWSPQELLELLPQSPTVEVSGRPLSLRIWRFVISGHTGAQVPLLFLDTDCEPNSQPDREITHQLYSGGPEHRLRQEAVLGLGGVAVLDALGYDPDVLHMNEGHCSLLPVAMLGAARGTGATTLEAGIAAVRDRCVFTTHTPVPAGHDVFEKKTVTAVLGPDRTKLLSDARCLEGGVLNMTDLGMRLSGFVNAVSLKHAQVSREMFPAVDIRSITNGVHVNSWTAPPVQKLLDEHVPGWQSESQLLRYATGIDLDELESAHRECKRSLFTSVGRATGVMLDPDVLTFGLARRATEYKRNSLVFSDPDRLRSLVDRCGKVQFVCSGKAHPRDKTGKSLIEGIFAAARALRGSVSIVFTEGYDLNMAKLLCSGSDVWLNTPTKPHEASGTSGMKAAANGVPSLSILDGWWIEGCVEGVTGWAIAGESDVDDASALYDKLEHVVVPMFYGDRRGFLEIMRNAIALNASFFSTDRMVREYVTSAYRFDSTTEYADPSREAFAASSRVGAD
jgi:glycogen phosphorylase